MVSPPPALPQSSYDGQTITYDAIGNPTSYKGATLEWKGRQLVSYTKGGLTVTYKYDADGLRTQKTVNGVNYNYVYEDGRLVYEQKEGEYELNYRYDDNGNLFTVSRYNYSSGTSNLLYAVNNTRGDVIELRSGAGEVNARYSYDSWGRLISVTNASGTVLGAANFSVQSSIRYRGYVYDTETGLYYLQSRYYDAETGRFLNADDVNFIGYSGEDVSYNAFTYCINNPTNYFDQYGYLEAVLRTYSKMKSIMVTIMVLIGTLEIAGAITLPKSVLVALVVAGIVVVATNTIGTVFAKKTKIPSKLKKDNRVKTPNLDKNEFERKKGGSYTHKKTKWTFKLSDEEHHGERHWHASPPNGKTGDYYNIDFAGKVI